MTFAPVNNGNSRPITVREAAEMTLKQHTGLADVYGRDRFGTGGQSGLFPNGCGGAGDIGAVLARMAGDKKENAFNTSGFDSFFSGGKDWGTIGKGMMDAVSGAFSKGSAAVSGFFTGTVMPAVMSFFGGGK